MDLTLKKAKNCGIFQRDDNGRFREDATSSHEGDLPILLVP